MKPVEIKKPLAYTITNQVAYKVMNFVMEQIGDQVWRQVRTVVLEELARETS